MNVVVPPETLSGRAVPELARHAQVYTDGRTAAGDDGELLAMTQKALDPLAPQQA
jgi:hypothetical protein